MRRSLRQSPPRASAIGATFGRLLLLAGLCSGCSLVHVNEPTDAALREKFERHREALDELRRLFEDDARRHGLTFVTATDANGSQCKDQRVGAACLSADRWREYVRRLSTAGVERIARHETPGIYFHVYRTPYWGDDCGCFRFRGLVYAPGVPKVEHDHDDFETRVDLGETVAGSATRRHRPRSVSNR